MEPSEQELLLEAFVKYKYLENIFYRISTVMTDVAFRFTLIIKVPLLKKLLTGQFDIETTFLFSELNKDIYTRHSDGSVKYMFEVHNVTIDLTAHGLLLKKVIYRLVHVTRQWWKKFKEVMSRCDYNQSKSVICLFFRKAADGEPISFVIIYVIDGGIIRAADSIKEVIAALGTELMVKTM
jgi:hypothetical protein